MPFASQKTDAITFPAEETTFAFFGEHRLSFSLWLKVLDPTLILSEKTVKKTGLVSFKKQPGFARDTVSLVSFWSCVKSRSTHLAETFVIPNSL